MASAALDSGTTATPQPGIARAERDIVALGIITAAIILFVGSGSAVLTSTVRHVLFGGASVDSILANALLLNIALIIFGWRRYVELTGEVRERRRAEETARTLAFTDPLTGCLNRRSLDSAIETLVHEARVQGDAVALFMLDLDKFKRANDLHGHQTGDAVLVATASRLRAILPSGAIIARIGGDEFTCAMRFDPARAGVVEQIAEQLNAALAEPVVLAECEVEISGSIGLARSDGATIPAGTDDAIAAARLQHHADLAMYQAKSSGRNRFCWFDPAMEKELRFRAELESGIREGIARGEFVPYYEKQIDIDTGRLTGFEMLARWQSPRHGLIAPDVFIPVAEEIGVIAELSESLIRQALADARDWDASLTLSVNVSPLQLRDPWFAQRLLKLLVEANFPPHRLDVEITETCLHENLPLVRSLVASLKNQGIRLSLDDFGTGYSSIAQLRSLPFDRIKIDRSFVSTLDRCKDSATIVAAITSLGQGLDLPLTAEGIESEGVLEELRKLGSFKGQGFLYGQPQDAQTVRTALAAEDLLVTGHDTADIAPAQDRAANG
ncbi:putative bifunctional diguanylate cyclase/phosphodiesterase [Novosphingobium sp. SG720]|uniref:putative bifunctional diguanylate cyclase/phosphodiesterase n=1 Tax=Novosphingobium TaxID=165696 RepID=UPI001446AACA|nr:EAL domain-containing protein [Novosphingobium sp. SG720]NKJ43625.1 diguanylate cyclase (GGDEF)-like protein [Novosphingobium sp. SG720]